MFWSRNWGNAQIARIGSAPIKMCVFFFGKCDLGLCGFCVLRFLETSIFFFFWWEVLLCTYLLNHAALDAIFCCRYGRPPKLNRRRRWKSGTR